MSNDCSGLPGIRMAFTHLVCVVVGAPGPAHSAEAVPAVSIRTGTITTRSKAKMAEPFCVMEASSDCEQPGTLADDGQRDPGKHTGEHVHAASDEGLAERRSAVDETDAGGNIRPRRTGKSDGGV